MSRVQVLLFLCLHDVVRSTPASFRTKKSIECDLSSLQSTETRTDCSSRLLFFFLVFRKPSDKEEKKYAWKVALTSLLICLSLSKKYKKSENVETHAKRAVRYNIGLLRCLIRLFHPDPGAGGLEELLIAVVVDVTGWWWTTLGTVIVLNRPIVF